MNIIRKALEQLVQAVDHCYDVDEADIVKAQAYAQAVLDLTPKETD